MPHMPDLLRTRTLRPAPLMGLLVIYGCAFAILHSIGVRWGTSLYYSLWFPAAGVRFAILWHFGYRMAPLLAVVELAVLSVLGVFPSPADNNLLFLGSIIAPPLAYGDRKSVV